MALALSIRFFKTKDGKYIKLLKPLLWVLTIVLLVEPIVIGHFMGDTVVTYQPLKFTALTILTSGQGAYGYEYYDPIEALFAYGNPHHLIYGFQYYLNQCASLGNITFGELYGKLDPRMLSYLGPLANVTLAQNCKAAVLSIEPMAPLVSASYYTMISAGILLAIAAVLILFTYLVKVPVLSAITDFINNKILGMLIGSDNVMPFLASAMAVLSAIAATAGWAAREIGRQPWTVYGLITTNEVAASDTITLGFVIFVVAILLAIAIAGAFAMYYVATRPSLLNRIRELIGAEAVVMVV
ncbi:cytochrome ubiquinol oxidase subunit I [Caldivirga sp. UBA161]|uniref:cytochrome ubiquinol oxidase subunit I n=1 Tax=Caldivirga sp. UBA161 TaxID=1915569 RepID=UPI0025C0B750|nr:cytochrome ubiquinol oxidase subunit I [Caldivirga sp. UBA161]